jgi:Uncharacterized protein conserved in bacteria
MTSAFDWSVRKLAARARSEHELRTGMQKAGFTVDEAEDALDRCREYGYIDDYRFAVEWVRQRRAGKHLSMQRLGQELTHKGVPIEVASVVLEELEHDEGFSGDAEYVRVLVDRRMPRLRGLPRVKQQRLLLSFLARRGYIGEEASTAVREALEVAGDSAADDAGVGSVGSD